MFQKLNQVGSVDMKLIRQFLSQECSYFRREIGPQTNKTILEDKCIWKGVEWAESRKIRGMVVRTRNHTCESKENRKWFIRKILVRAGKLNTVWYGEEKEILWFKITLCIKLTLNSRHMVLLDIRTQSIPDRAGVSLSVSHLYIVLVDFDPRRSLPFWSAEAVNLFVVWSSNAMQKHAKE